MVQLNNCRKMRSPGKAKNLKGKQKQRKSFVKNHWSTRTSANKDGVGSWFGALGLTKNNLLFQKWKLWRKSWCLVLVAWWCTLWCLFPSNMANNVHFVCKLLIHYILLSILQIHCNAYVCTERHIIFFSVWMAIKVPFSQHHLYFALSVSFDLIPINLSCTGQLFHT